MVRRVENTRIRPVGEVPSAPDVSRPASRPAAGVDSFSRGTRGISAPAARLDASRFGDSVTKYASRLMGMPLGEQASELAGIVKKVYGDTKK